MSISTSPLQKSGKEYAEYVRAGMYDLAVWEGRSAEELQISGVEMTPQNFELLAQCRDPKSGELLKARHKQKVNLYDFTIGAPKSLSLLALEDDRVRVAFLKSAARTIKEAEAATSGQSMVYVCVPHYTSRKSDPHLHVHAGIVNLTYNADKERWECLRPNFLYWPRHQMAESHREDLVPSLERLGYRVTDKPRQGFEIEGVSRALMDRFSTRSKEISSARAERLERQEFLTTRSASIYTRGEKQPEPKTYPDYLDFQRDKLTQSERKHLKQTVEKAYERSQKLGLHIPSDTYDQGSDLKPWSYGHRVSL